MREFGLDRKYKITYALSFVVFLAFLMLSFLLLFFSLQGDESSFGEIILWAAGILFFGFITILNGLTLKRLPEYDLVVDEEGIWYKHLGKEQGLVPWNRITEIRERLYYQRLDLLSFDGDRLIGVEYQINGFKLLRDFIIGRVNVDSSILSCREFSKSFSYHAFHIFMVFGFAGLGLYIGATGHPVLGYGGMSIVVVMITREYFTTAAGAKILHGFLEINYPLHKKIVPFSEIKDIQISDSLERGNYIPEVWIISGNAKKPLKLRYLGVEANILFSILRKAVPLESTE